MFYDEYVETGEDKSTVFCDKTVKYAPLIYLFHTPSLKHSVNIYFQGLTDLICTRFNMHIYFPKS